MNALSEIKELKKELINAGDIVVVLFKIKDFAYRRKITHLKKTIDNEISGYNDSTDIPTYRKVECVIRAFSPHHGYIPIYFQEEEKDLENKLKEIWLYSPIAQLQEACSEKDQAISFDLDLKNQYNFPSYRIVTYITVCKVFADLKNKILDELIILEQKEQTALFLKKIIFIIFVLFGSGILYSYDYTKETVFLIIGAIIFVSLPYIFKDNSSLKGIFDNGIYDIVKYLIFLPGIWAFMEQFMSLIW